MHGKKNSVQLLHGCNLQACMLPCTGWQAGQRTRKPSTALPPGTMHTRGTATTLVSSSQQDSTRPSVPCGMGTRLASSASAPRACGHQRRLTSETHVCLEAFGLPKCFSRPRCYPMQQAVRQQDPLPPSNRATMT